MSTMEPNSLPRKPSADSVNASLAGNQIVEVHSPTLKAFPKKFMESLMMQRPVLHKYSPEQVQIVYHLRNGDDVVKKRRPKLKNSTPNGREVVSDSTSSHSPSKPESDSSSSQRQFDHIGTNEVAAECDNVETKSIEALLAGATNVDLKAGRTHGPAGVSALNSNDCSSRDSLHDSNDVETLATCLERLDELAAMVVSVNDNMSKMETRLRSLENAMCIVAAQNSSLYKKFAKHLSLNAMVASDMKKLQSLLNNNLNTSIEEAQAVLKRANHRNGRVVNGDHIQNS